MRNRNIAAVSPLSDCANKKEGSGMGLHIGEAIVASPMSITRRPAFRTMSLVHELRGIDVRDGLHDRERVLRVLHGLAVELAAVGLVILLADGQLAGRRVDAQSQ